MIRKTLPGMAIALAVSGQPALALECADPAKHQLDFIDGSLGWSYSLAGNADSLNRAYAEMKPNIENYLKEKSPNPKIYYAARDLKDFYTYTASREKLTINEYLVAWGKCEAKLERFCAVLGVAYKGRFYCLSQPLESGGTFAPFADKK